MLLPVASCYPARVFCPAAVSASISLACGNIWGSPWQPKGWWRVCEGKRMCNSYPEGAGFQELCSSKLFLGALLTLSFSPTGCPSHLPVLFSAKKEETPVQPPEGRQLTGSSG